MNITDDFCHTCSCQIEASADQAFRYLSDGMKQGEWAFGSWDRRQVGDDLFVGTSMFDDTDPGRFLIYYHLGSDPDDLKARNMVRVVPGPVIEEGLNTCLVTLMAWRSAFMSDGRWKQLCVSHEAQMFIIKARIEAGS